MPAGPCASSGSALIFAERHDCTLGGVELVLILSERQDRALPSVGGKAQAAYPILQKVQKPAPTAAPTGRPQAPGLLLSAWHSGGGAAFWFWVWVPQNLAGICSEGPG